jgi:hypothetical protein
MPERVLGRSGTADSYLRVGLHVDSAMPGAATWAHGAVRVSVGQRVAGYLLTIGGYMLTMCR